MSRYPDNRTVPADTVTADEVRILRLSIDAMREEVGSAGRTQLLASMAAQIAAGMDPGSVFGVLDEARGRHVQELATAAADIAERILTEVERRTKERDDAE